MSRTTGPPMLGYHLSHRNPIRGLQLLACAAAFLSMSACADVRTGEEDLSASDTTTATAPSDALGGAPTGPTADCGVSPTTVLTGAGIAGLRIGRQRSDLAEECSVVSDTTEVRAEGHPARIVRVDLVRDTVEAEIVDDAVWRLAVRSPAFRTSDSLGVGTTLSRLMKFDGARPLSGEGRLFVQVPEHCGLSFELSEPASSLPPGNRDEDALASLPQDTRVVEVLAFGCDG